MLDPLTPLHRPAPTKSGQANGEFLAHLAMMDPARRKSIIPADFPHANPEMIRANVKFHGEPHAR